MIDQILCYTEYGKAIWALDVVEGRYPIEKLPDPIAYDEQSHPLSPIEFLRQLGFTMEIKKKTPTKKKK